MSKVQDKEFSEGFVNDVFDLMQMCADNHVDRLEIELEPLHGKKVGIEMIFRIFEVLEDGKID